MTQKPENTNLNDTLAQSLVARTPPIPLKINNLAHNRVQS
jgi:hypothetical protein